MLKLNNIIDQFVLSEYIRIRNTQKEKLRKNHENWSRITSNLNIALTLFVLNIFIIVAVPFLLFKGDSSTISKAIVIIGLILSFFSSKMLLRNYYPKINFYDLESKYKRLKINEFKRVNYTKNFLLYGSAISFTILLLIIYPLFEGINLF
ncbi:hypothetical protein [Aureibacter tunicatorum]|uniref:Uncharacterized protein n=1 Tax=Aureibacter tunicatorum TaxID=866807 RepID=A0AAE4BV93_9BACT|nr:hypothetical protein [Aureibacter tunicatorum]MDR6241647.1 hypothetical protein [Aureibacter tunicatorum]BDD07366.1 hypothetical protein AUTU_48490 [Aureibacter tunicatorum]